MTNQLNENRTWEDYLGSDDFQEAGRIVSYALVSFIAVGVLVVGAYQAGVAYAKDQNLELEAKIAVKENEMLGYKTYLVKYMQECEG